MPKVFKEVKPDSIPPWITDRIPRLKRKLKAFMDNVKLHPIFIDVHKRRGKRKVIKTIETVFEYNVQID
jgi:hypothetical protein